MFRFAVCSPVSALSALLFPAVVLAQQSTGNIVGTVSDPAGGLVPNVQVTISEIATTRSRTAITNGAGEYQAPYLVPGDYALTAEQAGFQKSIVNRITAAVSQTIRVDFRLEIGTKQQTVQVNADGAQLQSFAQLALLVPGVSPAVNTAIALSRDRGSMGTSIAIEANGFAST